MCKACATHKEGPVCGCKRKEHRNTDYCRTPVYLAAASHTDYVPTLGQGLGPFGRAGSGRAEAHLQEGAGGRCVLPCPVGVGVQVQGGPAWGGVHTGVLKTV